MFGCRCGIIGSKKSNVIWRLRYLKLTRTTADYFDIVSIEAWYNSSRIYATATTLGPIFENDEYPASSANDGAYDTIAHTDKSIDAFILFDFGSDVVVDKVRVIFRNYNEGREINIVLTATDNFNNPVFQVLNLIQTKEMSLICPSTDIIRSSSISNWQHTYTG